MPDESLVFRLTAQDLASAKFSAVNKQLGAMHGASVTASGGLKGLSSSFLAAGKQSVLTGIGLGAGIGAFNLMSTAISGTVGFMGDAVHGAIADEESITRLGQSLKANVPAWDGNTAAIEKRILAAQRLGFRDEELRASLALLVGATHDVGKAQKLQAAAMDLARFKGIDLQTASDALIKVEGGRYRILASLGIQLGKNATQTEVLAAIQKVAAGQAKAFGDSTAGALEEAGIAFDEAREAIGNRLMPMVKELSHFARDVLAPNLGVAVGAIGLVSAVIVASLIPALIAATVAGAPLIAALAVIGGAALAVSSEFDRSAKNIQMTADDVKKGIKAAAADVMRGTSAALREGGTDVKNAAQDNIVQPIWQAAYDAKQLAQQEAAKIPKAMGDAMLQREKDLGDSIATLLAFTKEALTPAQAKAAAIGFLTSDAYAQALASGKPAAIAKAQELANSANVVLWGAVASGAAAGTGVGKAWVTGLNAALAAGYSTSTYTWIQKYTRLLQMAGSPPYTHAIEAGLGVAKGWLGGVSKGLSAGNLNLPSLGGMSLSGGLTAAPAGIGGGTTIVNFNSTWPPTPQQAREVAEIVDRRLYYSQSGASRFPRG